MKFLDRHLPIIPWYRRAQKARFLPADIKTLKQKRKAAILRASALALSSNAKTDELPALSTLQFQLGDKHQYQLKALSQDDLNKPLKPNEVLFAPLSLAANRYITYYNSGYIQLDIEHFVDPNNTLNDERFKTVPCWGRCAVYRSNHPEIKEGQVFYGFWPLAAYFSREINEVSNELAIAYQHLPNFEGPKEWLKIIELDDFDKQIADNFEYIKIGYTYAKELAALDCFNAKQLVLSSASSMSAQIIAMCMKEINPSIDIIGLTSHRNISLVTALPFFDKVYAYDDIQSCPNQNKTLYFDALGDELTTQQVFDHFTLSRWWFYGEGSEKLLSKYLRKNRKGTFYSNLVDSYCFQLSHKLKDSEILDFFKRVDAKYQLESLWGSNTSQINSSAALSELYLSFLNNSVTSGKRFVYRSPLLK